MTTRIWKIPLPPSGKVEMPWGSRILTVREQADDICIWAEVNPDAVPQQRRFEVLATGQPIPQGVRNYIGTVMLAEGALVFHVYEDLLPEA